MPQPVELVQVDPRTLVPADYNPRAMPPEQAKALRASIKRWGFIQSVVVNRRTGWGMPTIVAGHQRVPVAIREGLGTIPAYVGDWSEREERQLNLALNRISGAWDPDKLRETFQAIVDQGGALDDTGFQQAEIDRAMAQDREGAEAIQQAAFDADRGVSAPVIGSADAAPPAAFPSYDEDIQTDYCCPKCGYSWSGKPK